MDAGILTGSPPNFASALRRASALRLDQYAQIIAQMIETLEPLHVLDYGCGPDLALPRALAKAGLTRAFKFQFYDPDVAKYASTPVPADVVVCLDLLNTGDDEAAEDTLDDLEALVDGVGFFAFETRSPEWWLPRIIAKFDLQTYQRVPGGSYAIVYGKPRSVIENTDGKTFT